MGRFDRYLLSQLMMLFGFFSLVLVLVYWVNRAVILFDRLIANGHSAAVFLEFSALTLPNVIRLVMPVSAFAAAVYVTNRLSRDSELVAAQAAGTSPWRTARPVAVFGLVVGLLTAVLANVLVPASNAQLARRTAEIAENVTARLLTPGTFLHPAEGVTFYIREITPEGELRDVFLSDQRGDGAGRTTYTAERALLLRGDDGPRLVMFRGLVQSLDDARRSLSVTRFDDFSYDIGALLDLPTGGSRGTSELSTAELLRADPATQEETGDTRAELLQEGHERIGQAALAAVTGLVGFAVLMTGGFSRFGLWRHVIGAVFALIVLELADNAAAGIARSDARLWALTYLPVALGLAMAAACLQVASFPGALRRRPRAVADEAKGTA